MQHGAQDRAWIADQSQADVAILADGAVIHVDLHQSQILADALAVAHAEVERRTHDQEHVGVGERLGSGAIEMMRIAGRQQAAACAVEVSRNIEAAQQRDGFLVAARRPDLLAVQDGRPLRIDENVGQFLDVARVADGTRRRPVMAGLRHHGLGDVDLAVEYVARNLQVHRAGRAVERLARRHRDHIRNTLGARDGRGKFRDWADDVDVRQILQRSHLVLSQRTLAADVQDRTFGAKRGGNARNRIREARPGGRDHAAELAGLACVAIGGMRGNLLMADVDDANPFIDAAIVDVDDVAAAKRENRVDALVLQRLGDQVAARYHARVAALALQGVFGGGARLGLSRRRVYGCHGASNFVNLSAGGRGNVRLRW